MKKAGASSLSSEKAEGNRYGYGRNCGCLECAMTQNVDRAARDLFSAGRNTRNIKYYFRQEANTADQLADYRSRAIAQIDERVSVENIDLDRLVLD